ncbi:MULTISPECIES: hypothetical protein [unclassified Leptolyngbya]|uniref:hypothetical protein n=1 Tax=unclassified Leptolyngbya TaxID=2650499 RepID=UPI00168895E1|nr:MULTISPECIES: hypothetical protein [unclassified Leptolyngbya]MBD1909210.1 hypothetical protein [Leptolyngbya sp. FACHB-8]MBD2153987.1 hypothetical protein [Leptolyngbya sp. FACHB-16]
MQDEWLSTIQRLLVIQLDTADAIRGAIATLQQHRPDISLILLEAQNDDGSSVSYILPGEMPLTVHDNFQHATIEWIREQSVDAAVVLSARERSPYTWAYRCYLAGVPIRIGQSLEFGGQVLSHCIAPPDTTVSDPHLHLLQTCGLVATEALPQI